MGPLTLLRNHPLNLEQFIFSMTVPFLFIVFPKKSKTLHLI
jgi:hypothetical protein